MSNKWYKEKVLKGSQDGRKIGFPTLNLSPLQLTGTVDEGVYISKIKYQNKLYNGLLFYGPRLVKNETHVILEIYVLDFSNEIYNETIQFTVGKFIRGVLSFQSMDELKIQINKDLGVFPKKSLDK